jgi:hypothetical protein
MTNRSHDKLEGDQSVFQSPFTVTRGFRRIFSFSKKRSFCMDQYKQRHHFRLDDATEAALAEICRHTFKAKSTMMRQYVQECVARDAKSYAEEAAKVLNAARVLRAV